MEGINERLQKKALMNRRDRYWICQLRNGTFQSMNLTEFIKNKGKSTLPSISNQ